MTGKDSSDVIFAGMVVGALSGQIMLEPQWLYPRLKRKSKGSHGSKVQVEALRHPSGHREQTTMSRPPCNTGA